MCQYLGGNRWKAHVIDCAENTVWDDQHKACNWFEKFKKRNENCQDYGTQSYSLWQSIGYFLYFTWKYCIDIELSKMFFFRSDSIRLTQTIRRAMKRKHRQISNDRGFTLCDAPSSSRK